MIALSYAAAVLLGSAWILAVDTAGAWLAKRGSVDYGLWMPGGVVAYVVFGASAAMLIPEIHLLATGATIGVIECTLGTLIVKRMGVYGDQWDEVMRIAPLAFPIAIGVVAVATAWGGWLVRR